MLTFLKYSQIKTYHETNKSNHIIISIKISLYVLVKKLLFSGYITIRYIFIWTILLKNDCVIKYLKFEVGGILQILKSSN